MRTELELDDTANFHFLDGLFQSEPIPDVEYECPAPNLRWYDYDELDLTQGVQQFAEMLTFKDMISPEDGVRRAWGKFGGQVSDATELMVEYARNVIEDEGPFDGVIGASEGGSAAATVLIDQLELARQEGRPCSMRAGIFFVSAAPLASGGNGYFLSDETDQRITVPTCHIYSEKDLLCWMAKALQNVCQEDGKTVILHDGGHTIPHTEHLMIDVAKFVRKIKHGHVQEAPMIIHNAASA